MNDLPESVLDAANKLISALGLHEDTRDTVETALADAYDTGRTDATHPQLANLLRAIRCDAEAVRTGRALTRSVPAARIINRVDQMLAMLGEPDTTPTQTPGADPDLLDNLGAAIARALDLSLDTTDSARRAEIGDWVAKARAAHDAKDTAEIRRLLATPPVTGPAAGWNDPLPGGAR